MHDITFNLFPGGKHKAFTMSYDDGREQDRRFVEIINTYGLKASFHLNSGLLDKEGYVRSDEVASLYDGHEVACHTVNHPRLPLSGLDTVAHELTRNRADLESLVGYPVRGFSYPCGGHNHDHRIAALLPALGIAYGRTLHNDRAYRLPCDRHRWASTCHHNDDLPGWTGKFAELKPGNEAQLFFVWGHSYEFDRQGNWDLLHELGARLGGDDTVWFATVIEIADYLAAIEGLQFAVDNSLVRNPCATDVWISVNGEAVMVAGGTTVVLS